MSCNDILLKIMMFYDYEFLDKRPNCRQPLHSEEKKCKILLLVDDGSPTHVTFMWSSANLKSTLFYFNFNVTVTRQYWFGHHYQVVFVVCISIS